MKESYGIRARRHYIHPYKEGHFCYGSKRECRDYKGTAQIIEWGAEFPTDVYHEIRYLRLLPSVSILREPEIPAFLGSLTRLSFLEVPLPLIPHLGPKSIPPTLKTLMVTNVRGYGRLLAKAELLWPERLEPTQLRALVFFTNVMDRGAMWPNLRIDERVVSTIEYLNTHLDPEGLISNEIERFTSLRFLEVDHVKTNAVVSHVSSRLKVLHMTECDRDTELSDLPGIPSLEVLTLNSFSRVIDCEIFLELPGLKEISIRNSKRIANAHRLKDATKLKSLEMVNCGNPLNDKEKRELEARGLEILNVQFS